MRRCLHFTYATSKDRYLNAHCSKNFPAYSACVPLVHSRWVACVFVRVCAKKTEDTHNFHPPSSECSTKDPSAKAQPHNAATLTLTTSPNAHTLATAQPPTRMHNKLSPLSLSLFPRSRRDHPRALVAHRLREPPCCFYFGSKLYTRICVLRS